MTGAPAGPAARLYRSLLVMVGLITVGLISGVVLVSIQNARTDERLTALEEYVAGKGAQRDAESARTNQRINDAICDLLDQLPEGGLLERPRHKYGCGPGIPVEQLTPDERQQLSGRATSSVPPRSIPAPASTATAPSSEQPPTAPAQSPATPSATPEAPPSPAPPLVDLGGLTAPFCRSAVVCF